MIESCAQIKRPSGHRVTRVLLLVYCAFIVYGSFIPFNLETDAVLLQHKLSTFQLLPYQGGTKNFSISDLVSNVLLFMPFGALLAGMASKPLKNRLRWVICFSGGLGLALGMTIETAQLFAHGRTSSLLDVMGNTFGAMVGGFLGSLLIGAGKSQYKAKAQGVLRERPSIILLVLFVLVLMADAFYPFAPTLDVSAVWGNLKRTQLSVLLGESNHSLADLIVGRVFSFAILGYLINRSVSFKNLSTANVLYSWFLAILFAIFLEGGKLFFVGRSPNIENFLMGGIGALLGVLFGPLIVSISIIRKHRFDFLLALMLLLIAYLEFTPFTWLASWDAVMARASRVEWLPIESYFMSNLNGVLFDLGKKVVLVCPLGFVLAARRAYKPAPIRKEILALWGFGIGLFFESLQLFHASRIPSVTDVFIFGASTWIGGSLFEYYSKVIAEGRGLQYLGRFSTSV